jgi:UDP-N-acetylmuramoyl-L-alanyl-D-glutamate--2,6-diaminopimelate ligase
MSAPLEVLLERIPDAEVGGDPTGIEITKVTFDHREVVPGALHCCLPGARLDGREFAAEARERGAAALLVEDDVPPGAVLIRVPPGHARPAMAAAACALEGDPAASMRMIGVTGTNGKTTVTHLCRSILETAGLSTAVIGTLGGVRTTPEAPVLQHVLAENRDAGTEAVAMEVTSHALAQYRADGIVFDVAVFTNLTQDHLDYHGTMGDYFEAKASLFTPAHARRGVICVDDEYGRRLLAAAPIPLTPYGIEDASRLRVGAEGASFEWRGQAVELQLGGRFNVLNALAAAAVARELGIDDAGIARGLAAAEAVRGRFEIVPHEGGVSVVVDYAHTPDALTAVLAAAREAACEGRLIVVFGCGGDRDRAKRPLMGHIATTAADIALVTSDNPRSEEPRAIIDEILAGCDGPAKLLVDPDRRAAIAEALAEARPGDVVVIAGKGHETVQELADRSIPFDDRQVVAELLAAGGRAR